MIQTATRALQWSPDGNDLQIIFIAGNEPFDQGRISPRLACEEAKAKNIIVNTIFCGDHHEGIRTGWKSGADITGGSYMSIEQNSRTVFIPSPYDDRISELNQRLNHTYVQYGHEGEVRKIKQETQDKNAASYSKSNEVNRAVSKTTHVYDNRSWDLVDASKDASFDINKVRPEHLPDTLRALSPEKRVIYIEQKSKEREKIKTEIIELNKQREAFIAKQGSNASNEKMLDRSMISAIKKQAESKNLKF